MAQINASIAAKIHNALAVISRQAHIKRSFLFGSHAENKADQWSDIDLAVFIEGVEGWDLDDRVRLSVQVQKEAGNDVEVHFFSTKALRKADPAAFATWVIKHGIEIPI